MRTGTNTQVLHDKALAALQRSDEGPIALYEQPLDQLARAISYQSDEQISSDQSLPFPEKQPAHKQQEHPQAEQGRFIKQPLCLEAEQPGKQKKVGPENRLGGTRAEEA